MLKALGNAWTIPELRHKLMFTAALIALYRLGAYVPLPGINREALAAADTSGNAITGLFGIFTGGAFNNLSVFSLGITQYTRYFTLVLAFIQSLAMVLYLRNGQAFPGVLNGTTIVDFYLIVLTLTAGTMLIMWIGELI